MNRSTVAPVVLIALLIAVAPDTHVAFGSSRTAAFAQGERSGAQPQLTFRAGVEVVTVTATVRDRRGRIVRDLEQSDFELIDSGMPRQILDFHAGDAPVSLAVLLDISGSMAVGGNIGRARDAVAAAMTTLRDGSDEAALFTFDSSLQEVVRFTTDLDRVRRVSLEGRPWGQTSLYDAVARSAQIVAERTNRHRAVLVITDGVDTASRMRASQVSAIASEIEVPVYLLTVASPVDHPGGDLALPQPDERAADIATLADLARWTGGDMRVASLPMQTQKEVADLVAELRHQYLITFEPGDRAGWHPLELRTRKKDLVVHARSGYTAGPSQEG